jgi:hypothetical protein
VHFHAFHVISAIQKSLQFMEFSTILQNPSCPFGEIVEETAVYADLWRSTLWMMQVPISRSVSSRVAPDSILVSARSYRDRWHSVSSSDGACGTTAGTGAGSTGLEAVPRRWSCCASGASESKGRDGGSNTIADYETEVESQRVVEGISDNCKQFCEDLRWT